MLEPGTKITAQQKYGPVFTGTVCDGSPTNGGNTRYTVLLTPEEQVGVMSHVEPVGVCIHVYSNEIIPNAINNDELISRLKEWAAWEFEIG